MEIRQRYEEGLLTLSIEGDLDAASSIAMDNVIKEAYTDEQYKILVNCKLLNYISSAGLGVFISYLEDFKAQRGSFVFFDMKEDVYDVFELLGLHNIFRIVESETEAKNLLKQ